MGYVEIVQLHKRNAYRTVKNYGSKKFGKQRVTAGSLAEKTLAN